MTRSAIPLRRALSLLMITGLAAVGCAPSTASGGGTAEDAETGTVRVWLFQEVNNAPKEKVVQEAVAQFNKEHSGAKVKVSYRD